MIREWIVDDNRIAVYDDISNVVYYRDTAGEVIEAVHPATDSEQAEYAARFPDVPAAQLQRKSVIVGLLSTALTALRASTADGVVTQAEFTANTPAVVAAMTAYSRYPDDDADVNKLALLIITQVSLAYASILTQSEAVMTTMAQGWEELSQKVDLINEHLGL
jgi:alkanesulfonate monooxygenase SsuD/methylene tetrahydromethanopterin reductase-like flavin-dependent oxidoreductase (luciferase family)